MTVTLQDFIDAMTAKGCNPTPSGAGYAGYCPVHESDHNGHKPSLSFAQGDKQPVITKCHVGCTYPEIMAALGLKPDPAPVNGQRRIVATYDYHDATGHVVSHKLRYEPKDFRQCWPDGNGGRLWKKPKAAPAVLYRLPELLAGIAAGETVWFCEGEKDCDRLAAGGLTVTTNIEGAAKPDQKAKWRQEYTTQLAGAARVILIPDHDDPGRAHMEYVAQTLRGKVGEVRTLELPGLPAKGDVSDWLNAGHTAEDLLALAESAHGPKVDKQKPITFIDDSGKEKLVSQQQAAAVISSHFKQALRFDVHHQAWRHYDPADGIFKLRTNLLNEAVLYKKIRELSGDFPFSAAYVAGVTRCLTWETATELTPPAGLICFKNGVLDLQSLRLMPHSPEYGFIAQMPFNWEPDAPDPELVIRWILEAVDGHADQVQLLRAYLNAMITGRADLQRFLELIGFGGSGKGTFIRLAVAVLGEENVHSTTLKQLEENRFETAKLLGKKLVVITDAEKWHGDVSMLKSITGQDPIRFEEKHRQAGDLFTYGGMVLIAANADVDSTDYSSGIQRRRITVRFDHVVPAEQKRDLDAEFQPYLPGVLKWALSMPRQAVTDYLRSTSDRVPSLKVARLDALAATNSVAAWMLDNVTFDVSAVTQVGVKKRVVINTGQGDGDGQSQSRIEYENSDQWLYPNYVVWCEERGKKPLACNLFAGTAIDVARNMLGQPFVTKESLTHRRGAWLSGLRLHELADTCTDSACTTQSQVIDMNKLHELSKNYSKINESSCTTNWETAAETEESAEFENLQKVHEVREVHTYQREVHAESMQVHAESMQRPPALSPDAHALASVLRYANGWLEPGELARKSGLGSQERVLLAAQELVNAGLAEIVKGMVKPTKRLMEARS